jgi:hypothetical protein
MMVLLRGKSLPIGPAPFFYFGRNLSIKGAPCLLWPKNQPQPHMPSSSAFSSDTRAKRARLDDASMMMQEEDVVLVVVPHPSPVGFVDPESPEVQEELAKANNMTWEQYQALYAKFAPTKQQ